jgi:hypothetical protein
MLYLRKKNNKKDGSCSKAPVEGGGVRMIMNEGNVELGKLEHDNVKEQRKVEASKNFIVADKTSCRVIDKTIKTMEKSQNRREATYEGKNPFSILDSFTPQHFVNVATSCGIKLCSNEDRDLDVILTMLDKEGAQAMLAEARVRKEREL